MEWQKMRRFRQQISDEECIQVLKESWRGVLSMHGENGYPYGVPVDFYYDEEDGKIYIHGAKQGNKIDLLQKDNKVCFTVWDKGFVKENDWALNIKSVIIFGHIDFLSDPAQIEKQCRKLGLKYYPTAEGVEKEIQKAVKAVNMLVLTIDHMTGKLVNES